MKAICLVVVLVCLSDTIFGADLTLTPGAYGPEVVEAVINLIRENCIFAEDKRYLRRLAYVESRDGTAPNTYKYGYNGGIWQVDEDKFKETQHNYTLQVQYNIILNVFHIDWSRVSWYDLRMPLYSGIAAALYTILKSGHDGMDWRIEEQASFWEKHYHAGGGATNFTIEAGVLDKGCHANQAIDLVFLLDSSSSLTTLDFLRAIEFMKEVVRGFDISTFQTHVGVVLYSTQVSVEFQLNQYYDEQSVIDAIDRMTYRPGSTATAKAIQVAVEQVFNPMYGSRPNVVKVLLVITDGASDDPVGTMYYANMAHSGRINVFSVGVGSLTKTSELNTLASSPTCTHVYKAATYEQIRFLTDEIKRATCIAPLYINSTYSCSIERCPPLAYITPPGGVTLMTNITCGGMNVYTAFNNPYPGEAHYEVQQHTTGGETTGFFINTTTTKTLYMNMKDSQLIIARNGSNGCIATITPLPGYHLGHENWNFPNPCTPENIRAGLTRFPHPYEKNKFLMCDLSGKLYIVICPPGEVFLSDCNQCVGNGSIVSADCTTQSSTNPCTEENILLNHLFFPFPGDVHKFIHCDVWGKAWERDCPSGEEWDQTDLTCIVPSGYEICRHHKPSDPYLYPHPCNSHLYIQCDTFGESWERPCELNFVFYELTRTCVAPGSYPGAISRNTCGTGYTTYQPAVTQLLFINSATINPNTINTVNGGYAVSTTPYDPPCTMDNIRMNSFFFPYIGSRHQYIHCDAAGYAHLLSCSGNDFYDPVSHTCVDGPVSG
ncbi:hypothetical protein ACJMK2_039128 [Sinanodonta woodiana]|uniref:Uncharacterized protein n=1 Tax=Sinanodonta woodiana TaxID=1069815 RepID=A0ABD3WB29_SINWO